jgi:hypothetical protein
MYRGGEAFQALTTALDDAGGVFCAGRPGVARKNGKWASR